MQVQKFGLVDWERRGKNVAELEYVNGIYIYSEEGEVECGACGQREPATLLKIYVKQEDDEEEELTAAIARMQGEFWTWLQNACTPAWIGVVSRHHPRGLFARQNEVEFIFFN